MKTSRLALFLLLVPLFPALSAQDAPYVTRLNAQAGPRSVLLTWQDPEGWPGAKYEVWRSDKELVKDSLPTAKLLATVEQGVEAYEDSSVTSASFYLVLLKDASGVRKGYFVPYRNKTTTAVKPDGAAAATTARVKVGSVTYVSPQVLVPFSAVPPDRKLVVFRRAAAITSLADLKDATLLGNTTGAQSPYRDTPPAGLEFYYAVLDAQAFADGKSDAFSVENTTEKPAGFPLVTLPDSAPTIDPSLRPGLDSTRSLPLPRLQVGTEPDSGAPMAASAYEPVAAKPLPPDVQAVLKRWAKGTVAGGTALPPPVVLPEERSGTQTGAARYLQQIRQAYLDVRDWKGAVTALETVLKLTLDERTEARARFYLGEALGWLKDYRRAFVEVLAAREQYPSEAGDLLEALFSLLESTPD